MEFPEAGKHCEFSSCKQLDFLPSECAHCSCTFCTHHLSPFIHSCKQFNDKKLNDAEFEERARHTWKIKCSLESCSNKELIPFPCEKCHSPFCRSHQHADTHRCPILLKEKQERKQKEQEKKAVTENRLQVSNQIKAEIDKKLKAAKSEGGTKAAMAKKLALMKLKGKSKGDGAVPQQERVYFYVQCFNSEQNPQPLPLFLSKKWTLGKCIDFIAKQARVKNRNNQPSAPKLHLFYEDCCVTKDRFDVTVEELLGSEIIVEGEIVRFERVEPPNN